MNDIIVDANSVDGDWIFRNGMEENEIIAGANSVGDDRNGMVENVFILLYRLSLLPFLALLWLFSPLPR